MYNSKTLAVCAGLLIGIASHAQAGTFAYTSYSVTDNAAGATGNTAQIIDSALGVNVDAYVGRITLFGANGSSLNAYCVDIDDDLAANDTYNIANAIANSNLNASQISTINTLIANTNGVSDASYSAVQFAIWMTEYGSAVSFSGDQADQDLAVTYLNNVTDGDWKSPPNPSLSLPELTPSVDGGKNQTLVEAPEPSALAMFGVALFGLGCVGYRRRQTV
jgi:hypothetical protein